MEILNFSNIRKEIWYLQAVVEYSVYYINTNEIPNLLNFAAKGVVYCVIFTCENMFSCESSPGISLLFI